MLSSDRTNAQRGKKSDVRLHSILLCALLLTIPGGCRREPVSMQPVSGASPAPSPTTVVAADAVQPTARVVDGDPPPVKGVDMPTDTIAPSSAAATRTASEPPILRAVRVGQHDGNDRLVFEFDGTGLPAWRVEYVGLPVTDCGAGHAVPVAGDARLQIRFSGAHAHTPEGQPTSGPARRKLNQPTLRELVRLCDFEAEVTWVAGLASATAYTPRVLTEPSRLVIDIAH